MNARIFFGLTIAVILGLGGAVFAKYSGLFERTPPPPPVEPPQVQVVFARKNLYKGYGINQTGIAVGQLSVNDPRLKDLQAGDYFSVAAAALDRIPLRDIQAGEILLQNDLCDQKFPDQLEAPQGMVGVNVDVLKEDALGGNIRRGQRVNIVLVSRVYPPGKPEEAVIRSAVLAHNVEVLTVGNRLIATIESFPDSSLIPFTIAATPYRAALIQQARYHGAIVLQQATLPDAVAVQEDQAKSDLYNQGKLVVGSKDIADLLQIKRIRTAPTVVKVTRHIVGVDQMRVDQFAENGNRLSDDPTGSKAKQGTNPSGEGTAPLEFVILPPDAQERS